LSPAGFDCAPGFGVAGFGPAAFARFWPGFFSGGFFGADSAFFVSAASSPPACLA